MTDNFTRYCSIGFRLDVPLRASVQLRLRELKGQGMHLNMSEYMRWLLAKDTWRQAFVQQPELDEVA